MSGWGCPHELDYYCKRLRRECRPTTPGCVLQGRGRESRDEPDAETRWHRAARSRLHMELAGLSFALASGAQPEDYARHLWGAGAAGKVGNPCPSPSEYLRWEAEAVATLWPGVKFRMEEEEGLARLVLENGCLGGGWGRPWATARQLGLSRTQVCRYCEESFRLWGAQLGLAVTVHPQPGDRCILQAEMAHGAHG